MKVVPKITFLNRDIRNDFVDKKLAITTTFVLTINDIIIVHQTLSGLHNVLKDLTELV